MSQTNPPPRLHLPASVAGGGARVRLVGDPKVVIAGYCPMGCGQTLGLTGHGAIHCFNDTCHRPSAASEILDDQETQHIVTLTPVDFTVWHPLRERLGGALLLCGLDRFIAGHALPPQPIGYYRVSRVKATGKWAWERISMGSLPSGIVP